MIQSIKVALFLSTYFHVCLLPNSAGNKDCCGFVTCYFIILLKVSLFHIFLISLDRDLNSVMVSRSSGELEFLYAVLWIINGRIDAKIS